MSGIDIDDLCESIFGGLAEPATFTAPGGDPVPCRVIMDYGVLTQGDYTTVASAQITAAFLLAEITPVAGAVIVLDTPSRTRGDTFTLDAIDPTLQSDGDSRWTVIRGTP